MTLPTGALEFAKDLAREGGQVMRDCFYLDNEVKWKENETPVTLADEQINAMVIDRIMEKYPDHSVLGEEASHMVEGSEWLWVCDPIDGTHSFAVGIPVAMFSLALVKDGESVLGVAYDPIQDMMFHATAGEGAYCNGQRLQVSHRGFDGCQLAGSSSGWSFEMGEQAQRILKQHRLKKVQRLSGTVFKGMLVARGKIDGYYYKYDSAHDIAALKIIVTEAGGKVTDAEGREQRYDGAINGAIVSNGLVHDDLVKLVKLSIEQPR